MGRQEATSSSVPTTSLGLSLSGIQDLQKMKVTSLLDKVRDIWPKGPKLF